MRINIKHKETQICVPVPNNYTIRDLIDAAQYLFTKKSQEIVIIELKNTAGSSLDCDELVQNYCQDQDLLEAISSQSLEQETVSETPSEAPVINLLHELRDEIKQIREQVVKATNTVESQQVLFAIHTTVPVTDPATKEVVQIPISATPEQLRNILGKDFLYFQRLDREAQTWIREERLEASGHSYRAVYSVQVRDPLRDEPVTVDTQADRKELLRQFGFGFQSIEKLVGVEWTKVDTLEPREIYRVKYKKRVVLSCRFNRRVFTLARRSNEPVIDFLNRYLSLFIGLAGFLITLLLVFVETPNKRYSAFVTLSLSVYLPFVFFTFQKAITLFKQCH